MCLCNKSDKSQCKEEKLRFQDQITRTEDTGNQWRTLVNIGVTTDNEARGNLYNDVQGYVRGPRQHGESTGLSEWLQNGRRRDKFLS